jgi:hypothetical protein
MIEQVLNDVLDKLQCDVMGVDNLLEIYFLHDLSDSRDTSLIMFQFSLELICAIFLIRIRASLE